MTAVPTSKYARPRGPRLFCVPGSARWTGRLRAVLKRVSAAVAAANSASVPF